MSKFFSLLITLIGTEIGKHASIVIVLILASSLISSSSYWHASHLAQRWVSGLQANSRVTETTKVGFCKPPGSFQSASTNRLEDDVREVQARTRHHLDVMVYFYANYYRAIIMSSILGAVSGISLFYIANKGWATASNYVVTTFVISTVIGAYFFSLIAVFKEQDNITANKALYLQYVALENRILSYCATGSSEDPASDTLGKYVHQVDREMAAANDVALAFDSSKITDYKVLLQQEMNSKKQPTPPSADEGGGAQPATH